MVSKLVVVWERKSRDGIKKERKERNGWKKKTKELEKWKFKIMTCNIQNIILCQFKWNMNITQFKYNYKWIK